MNNKFILFLGVAILINTTSCWWEAKGDFPGIEYAPDMYYSKGYEPYTQYNDTNKYRYNPYYMSMRTPVEGTVAVGQMDYAYPFDNTNAGLELAAANLKMPTDLTVKEQMNGERLYGIYCGVCHGEKGGNDGTVSSRQATLKPVSFKNFQDAYFKNLTPGHIYHVVTYGKNNMGSYASALDPRERWSVISYIDRLRNMDSLGNIPAIIDNSVNNAAPQVDLKSLALQYDEKSELKLSAEESKELNEIISHIEFETGSNKIKASSMADLDKLVIFMNKHSSQVAVIKGHTDNVGDENANIQLSNDRANAVKEYLISKGISKDMILAIGFGPTRPIADNKTEEGKQKNRRVEIGFKNK